MSAYDDPSRQPTALLKRFQELEGQFFESEGSYQPSFDGLLHPDFVLIEPDASPYGGKWRGHDGLLRFLMAMNADWVDMGPQNPPEFLENEGTAVALATLQARSRTTRRLVVFPVCQVARVRDGLLAETRVFYWEISSVNQALGLGTSPAPVRG